MLNSSRISKLVAVTRLVLTSYIFCSMLSWLILKAYTFARVGGVWKAKRIPQEWIDYSPLFVGFVLGSLMVGHFIWITRFRKNDPYRYFLKQHRFLEFSGQVESSQIEDVLKQSKFSILKNISSENQIDILADRSAPITNLHFGGTESRPSLIVSILGSRSNGKWIFDVCCQPEKRHIFGDFTNTIYFSLEEIDRALLERGFKRDKVHHKVN